MPRAPLEQGQGDLLGHCKCKQDKALTKSKRDFLTQFFLTKNVTYCLQIQAPKGCRYKFKAQLWAYKALLVPLGQVRRFVKARARSWQSSSSIRFCKARPGPEGLVAKEGLQRLRYDFN